MRKLVASISDWLGGHFGAIKIIYWAAERVIRFVAAGCRLLPTGIEAVSVFRRVDRELGGSRVSGPVYPE
ncbi:hypothetical protein [Nocardia panacis]|uniref:hypothetical protein n=1 Tax=Nocardia panacis TaxID=2340916 RepID=UPI0011C3616C|nr:hypothetical protein [Nocardia panacis]